jgi:DNA primase small subunit
MPSAETESPTPELMLAFYRRLYPFKSIFKWLNHEHTPSRLFTHREIAFTLQNDVYLRYNSFMTADEFKTQTCTLNPTRFEIGPVYTARVSLCVAVFIFASLIRRNFFYQASGQKDRAIGRI